MTITNQQNVTRQSKINPNEQNPMNWNIYNLIMNYYSGNDYQTLRLRIATLLLSIIGARISQILGIKVGCLITLRKDFLIEIDGQTLFITNRKSRKAIKERNKALEFVGTLSNNLHGLR